jgi:ADP-heptose:LPS heptosyltransferase
MKRIVAIRQDNNGDVTLVGPALRALAADGNDVTLVCGPGGEGAARLMPGVRTVEVVRADWIEGTPEAVRPEQIAADVARFAAFAPDEAFIFTSFHQSPLPTALLLRLAGVRQIAAVSVDYPGSLLDTRVRVDDDIHEVLRALAVVAARGYHLPPGDEGRLAYSTLPARDARLPERYVAVQPGATVPARAWAPEKLRALVARLRGDGHAVVLLGSAGEAELVRTVAGDSGALDLAGRTSYAEFAAVIRDAAALVVGNSSGIHIASAVGTPVVTIFAPTILPARFAPYGVPFAMLGDHAIACAGCRARICPFGGQPCTAVVTVDDVVTALHSLGLERRTSTEMIA